MTLLCGLNFCGKPQYNIELKVKGAQNYEIHDHGLIKVQI